MQPNQDYKQLLTDVIKKQIVILGPDITLSKARNVKGLTVANDGTVTNVEGQPQEVTQALIDQFVQLSGLIVKKTMEPLLNLSQPAAGVVPPIVPPVVNPLPAAQAPTSEPTAAPAQTTQPATTPPADAAQAAINAAMSQPGTQQATQPNATPPQTPPAPQNVEPAKNPLAA